MKKIILIVIIFMLALSACAPADSTESTGDLDAAVQATLQALTAQAANPAVGGEQPAQGSGQSPTSTPEAAQTSGATTGGISGKLSYPSEGIPPLTIIAFNIETGYYYWTQTAGNATTYQLDNIPPGSYHVFAYSMVDANISAAYDQFYVCGLHQGCADMSLIAVTVKAGEVTPNIDPGDWYNGDKIGWQSFPNDPNIPLLGDQNGIPAPNANTGSIAGYLSYPSSGIPAMTVLAVTNDGSGVYYSVKTNAGQSTYQIDNIPPGFYTVVAYANALSGGYSQAVPCGLTAACTDHSAIPVQVQAGQVTANINPGDWYAPPGAFPSVPIP